MDSDVEDVLELGLQGDDVEGMDLDEPIQPLTLRVSGETSTQDPSSSNPNIEKTVSCDAVAQGDSSSTGPIVGRESSSNQKPRKKKKKSTLQNPAVMESKAAKMKRRRIYKRQKARAELQARMAAVIGTPNEEMEPTPGTSSGLSETTVRSRIHYDELVPSAIGHYYRPNAPRARPIYPAGFFSDSEEDDEFHPEELLEPEDRPWMKGRKKPQPLTPAVEISPLEDGSPPLERSKQRYYESPSTRLAKYAIRDKWKMAEREVLMKELPPIRHPRPVL